MKYFMHFFLTSMFALFTFSSQAGAVLPQEYSNDAEMMAGWQKLGSKKVNYRLDRDEINVTIREGLFNKIKFKVKNGGVNMHKVVVHFGNGGTQNIKLKNNFRRGSESRVIDLEGGNRVIRKVVFWYDSKNVSLRKARVELWAL